MMMVQKREREHVRERERERGGEGPACNEGKQQQVRA
jgi:hypothetical protein